MSWEQLLIYVIAMALTVLFVALLLMVVVGAVNASREAKVKRLIALHEAGLPKELGE